ncbi:MAG: ATP-binding protein [Thermoanaerobaculia bacterium]|nr:ATP-binding protein [Thermoanaerobaculia bacterium]
MDRDLQAILLRDNPWLLDRGRLGGWLAARVPERYQHRRAAETAWQRWGESDRAHLVIGPRQAGKSTLIWRYLAQHDQPALYVDCEQTLAQAWCRSAPLFLADLESLMRQPVTLFFDEVQHLEQAGLFIKGLVDRKVGVPILVTGSSSYHLGARTRESLAGRATRTRLLPFSFSEVCQDLAEQPEIIRSHLLVERFSRHVRYGGYPEIWLSENPEPLLTELVEAMILRDASDLFRIGRPDAFRRLLQLLAGQIGQLVNLAEWAGILGIARDTVASYLEILESGHVVATLPPFAGGKRAELTRQPKVYLIDNGIRHRLIHDFRPLEERTDRGPALESWVFTELWKALPEGATLHFWRSASGAEVDFVIARGETLVGIEVKAQALARPKLTRSSRSFIEAYQPATFFVLNTGLEHHEKLGATEVRWGAAAQVSEFVGGVFRGGG